ncbi:hypothetical protein J1N35_029129 [Gossypium stocksii]|uniref:Uncharacterized protein n=1 Tax=Gossypium stocksii TaxID=47602 RepID=A0A9D3UXA5_9ROSI|nr:hypothetical protein J1N35_029129 [Gossypium stocksii]
MSSVKVSFQTMHKREHICVGYYIYKEMLKCISHQKKSTYFKHLIIALCYQANIPISLVESFTRPTRSMIGNNLYDQFLKL